MMSTMFEVLPHARPRRSGTLSSRYVGAGTIFLNVEEKGKRKGGEKGEKKKTGTRYASPLHYPQVTHLASCSDLVGLLKADQPPVRQMCPLQLLRHHTGSERVRKEEVRGGERGRGVVSIGTSESLSFVATTTV